MKADSGEPAFNNVDELLAERIVKHSRRHSERPESRTATPPEKQQQPSEGGPKENSGPLFVVTAIVLLALLFLLYRLLQRESS